ncbi:MAG: GerAB/ArcD/ProY family transporter, partial [Turicibacter sp.]
FLPLKDILNRSFGKFLGTIIGFLYAGYFIYIAAYILRETTDLIQLTIMHSDNILFIAFILMLPVIYGIFKGFNVVARSAIIWMMIITFFGIFVLAGIFSSNIFKMDYLTPVMAEGIKPILNDVKIAGMINLGEIVVFLTIFPLMKQSDHKKSLKVSLFAISVATVSLAILGALTVGILGPTLIIEFVYPFFNAMKMVGLNVFFERFDAVAIVFLMATCFYKIAIFSFAGTVTISSYFKKFTYQQLIIPFGILIAIGSIYVGENRMTELYNAFYMLPKYAHPIFMLYFPFVRWIVSEIKFRKNKS